MQHRPHNCAGECITNPTQTFTRTTQDLKFQLKDNNKKKKIVPIKLKSLTPTIISIKH